MGGVDDLNANYDLHAETEIGRIGKRMGSLDPLVASHLARLWREDFKTGQSVARMVRRALAERGHESWFVGKWRDDPKGTLEIIASEAGGAIARITRRQAMFRVKADRPAVKFLILDRCCAGARAMKGAIFRNGEQPDLPLAGCDWFPCQCGESTLSERQLGLEGLKLSDLPHRSRSSET